jgi:hypothetical protein
MMEITRACSPYLSAPINRGINTHAAASFILIIKSVFAGI